MPPTDAAASDVQITSERIVRIRFPSMRCASIVAMTTIPPSVFGIPALRTEDPRFLRGEGRYLANLRVEGALVASFARSIFPHAVVKDIGGLDEARAMPGVAAAFVADDLGLAPQPPSGNVEAPGGVLDAFHRAPIARDRLRFVGEPYAVVVASTAAQAADAAEVVWADVDPLPAVLDAEAAMVPGAPPLFPERGRTSRTRSRTPGRRRCSRGPTSS